MWYVMGMGKTDDIKIKCEIINMKLFNVFLKKGEGKLLKFKNI